MNKKEYEFIKIKKVSGSIGAVIENVQLNNDLNEEVFDEIYDAFLKYQVIFFRDQKFSPESQKSFANKIGKPIIYPFVKGLENFPEITPILKKETDTNNFGGDTEFSNQDLAYNTLSEGMKNFLNNQKAVNISGKGRVAKTRSDIMKHSSVGLKGDELEAIHPVVRTHPETKRKSLYVNEAHTTHFVGMSVEESTPILEYLYKHQIKSEFTCRFKWEKGSVAIWDNRCTMHYPVNDYHGYRRLMHRITFQGDKPF